MSAHSNNPSPPAEQRAAEPDWDSSALMPSDLVDDPARATIAAGILRGLVEAVEAAGVQRDAFQRATGLSWAQLDAPDARVPIPYFMRIVETALALTGDETLGLRWAHILTARMFAPISHLITHVPRLREGFELLARYYHVLTDLRSYTISERAGRIELAYLSRPEESAGVARFTGEMFVGGFFRFIGSYGVELTSRAVSFAHAEPGPTALSKYERFFGGKVRFGQPFSGLTFDAAVLRTPSPQRDDEVRDAMRDVAAQRLQRIKHQAPWTERVRDCLLKAGGAHRTDMQRVAHELDLSARTLRRRLAEEGQGYDAVAGQVQSVIAMRMLRESDSSIQAIAFELGFASASTFHRAFKRWTGLTPRAYRESQLKPSD